MNVDEIKIDLNGVSVNTRPVINGFIRQWFSVHDGEGDMVIVYAV